MTPSNEKKLKDGFFQRITSHQNRPLISAFTAGVLFSIGLGISGMTKPSKVIAFLDVFGIWDPSLIFVMVGAIMVYAVGYRLIIKKTKPLLADSFHIPILRKVDRPLALGAVLFGIGWGLAGFCPGPALTSLVSLEFQPLLFVASMFGGMTLFEMRESRKVKS